MIDCHFHLWTEDESSPKKRAERADQIREQMDAHGVDRIALIGEVGNTVEEMRAANETVAAYVAEHPDRFYGWARVDPRLGDDAVAEFRWAVEEGGLVGLKHHFHGTPVNISDPEFFPLAEAAVEMDVPIIAHVMQRTREDREEWDDAEAYTEDVRVLAERYPDLKLISAHIAAGGDPEYRIRNLRDLENVYLDVSGSNCERGVVELAAAELGVDRLVFGTDTWFASGVGKLDGLELPPEAKVEIAFNFETLVGDHVPNRFTADELAERKAVALERFEALAEPREETIVVANAFLGRWPFRPFEETAEELLAYMDQKGVDRALVSAPECAWYRNVQHGNERLAAAVDGWADRLLPIATINPTYPGWEDDLEVCVTEHGMRGVKLLPAYHDYEPNDPAAVELLDACAARDLPVIVGATLEDQRGRHPRTSLRGFEDGGSRMFTGEQVDAIIDLLHESPDADVILADMWSHAARVRRELHEVMPQGVRLRNRVRSGKTLFVLDDLYCYFVHQGGELVENVGAEHLVVGPKLPFWIFEAGYTYLETLPVDEATKDAIRAENVLSLFE